MNGRCKKSLALLAGITLLASPPALAGEQPRRGVEEGAFVSHGTPKLGVRIDPRFRYLGQDEFTLADRAAVQRHYWVDATDGQVSAMVVFQFEGLLEGVEGHYRFDIPETLAGGNFRYSPQRIRLGDLEYVHNTWVFDHAASARSDPGAEAARAIAFLAERGYALAGELIMSRYVTEVGPERRDELIVFYMVPLERLGHRLADFPAGAEPSPAFDRVSETVTREGRAALRFEPAAGEPSAAGGHPAPEAVGVTEGRELAE